jgi:hypothetical protein
VHGDQIHDQSNLAESVEDAWKRLADLIERDRGAWLVATTDEHGIEWAFTLCSAELSRHGDTGNPPLFPRSGATLH